MGTAGGRPQHAEDQRTARGWDTLRNDPVYGISRGALFAGEVWAGAYFSRAALADDVIKLSSTTKSNNLNIVYRGLEKNHPQRKIFEDTKQVVPWGWPDGHDNIRFHVNHNDTESIFTSWTLSEEFARKVAGDEGIVLAVDLNNIINPREYSYKWSHWPDEQEVTITAPIDSAWKINN